MSHVLVYPSDGMSCGHYRMIWPGLALLATGKPVKVMNRRPVVLRDGNLDIGTAHTVVFQRPTSALLCQAIEVIQRKGIKVVIDMDDSLSTIHPKNSAFKSHQPNWMHAARACDLADMVTVTTAALAEEYGKHGRVSIVPNHIPESYLRVQRLQNEVPVVGWAGSTATHPDDLTQTHGMINQVLGDTGAKFAAFGDIKIFQDMGIRQRPHEHWGFTSLPDYPKRLVGLDIGLVPLRAGQFNESKSWLKGLEYASLGVVPVVTPIGDYKNLIDLGIALPAASPQEWYDVVKELILDSEMRVELSNKCRKVAAGLTIEANTDRWWDAWKRP